MFRLFKKKTVEIEEIRVEEKVKQDKRRKTLPKELKQLIENNNIEDIKKLYKKCRENAYDTFTENNVLCYRDLSEELIRWFIEQGCDINYVGRWKKTPLHYQASYYENHVQLYLDLGANIEALDYMEQTPLHYATDSKSLNNVKTLVESGANIYAKEKLNKLTPIEFMLLRGYPMDLPKMYEIVLYLLEKGNKITDSMKDSIIRIGKDFEFHKSNMAIDTKDIEEYLYRFYKLFDVTPVEQRKIYDGVSLIIPKSQRWQDIHEELWDLLVPSQGHASTIQGEVVRINGKVSHEILGNGACNWDEDYKEMIKSLLTYLSAGISLSDELIEEVRSLIRVISLGDGDKELNRLAEISVIWILDNPKPILLDKVDYKR
ncbi:MAG: ankyrin repeat domain-containing protein [Coprobacillus sp.]